MEMRWISFLTPWNYVKISQLNYCVLARDARPAVEVEYSQSLACECSDMVKRGRIFYLSILLHKVNSFEALFNHLIGNSFTKSYKVKQNHSSLPVHYSI